MITSEIERVLALPHRIDLRLTLGPVRRGTGDPSMIVDGTRVWRATRTPEGPATLHLELDRAEGTVHAWAWGPGAGWALETLPDLVGAVDDDSALTEALEREERHPGQRRLRDVHRRLRGLRIPRTRAVLEALVPSILEQKVTGKEARRSYRELVRRLGEPAPGPAELVAGLMVPPSAETLASTPSWTYHQAGVEEKRALTIRRACGRAERLEQLVELPPHLAQERMMTLPGIGPWTAAEVALVAFGDPDAVSVGDYHLPHQVAWFLTDVPRSDDARMLELLEPYRGQRGRVMRLIAAGGGAAPAYGPRRALRSFRRF
ncbi:MAG: hypothetical protein JWL73_89 [Actinomycetia bacterium]|nr:hypothetical protein [Actinomycetes bacterium]